MVRASSIISIFFMSACLYRCFYLSICMLVLSRSRIFDSRILEKAKAFSGQSSVDSWQFADCGLWTGDLTQRYPDNKHAPFSRFTFYPDFSTMGFNYFFHDCKTDPASPDSQPLRFISAIEPVEYFFLIFT